MLNSTKKTNVVKPYKRVPTKKTPSSYVTSQTVADTDGDDVRMYL